jgi:mRNA interferase RelE/StbE
MYRIRVGSYRVIYSIFDDRLLVVVLRIGDRKMIYRGL